MSNFLNLKSFFKFLARNKAYTAINLFGLSVSLMFVILIATYVTGELTTDRYHENVDRTFVLTDGEYMGSACQIGYRLEERYPEIGKVCHVMTRVWDKTPLQKGDASLTANLMLADSTFFDFFSFPLVVRGGVSIPPCRQGIRPSSPSRLPTVILRMKTRWERRSASTTGCR